MLSRIFCSAVVRVIDKKMKSFSKTDCGLRFWSDSLTDGKAFLKCSLISQVFSSKLKSEVKRKNRPPEKRGLQKTRFKKKKKRAERGLRKKSALQVEKKKRGRFKKKNGRQVWRALLAPSFLHSLV